MNLYCYELRSLRFIPWIPRIPWIPWIPSCKFEATTPYGPKKMCNVSARTGKGDKGVIALASHYDTKYMESVRFVGANDGASSTGLLLELARVVAKDRGPLDYWLVFLDGEEAFVELSSFDSTHGSPHLARRWKKEGVTD